MRFEFALDDYDFMSTGALVQKRAFSPGQTYAALGLWLLLAGGLVAFGLGLARDWPMTTAAGAVVVLAAAGATQIHNRRLRLYANRLIGEGPVMSGPISFTFSPSGVFVENPRSRTLYQWSAVTDVLAHGDGLLVLIGPMHYLPMPAGAFADTAARDALIAEIRDRASLKEI